MPVWPPLRPPPNSFGEDLVLGCGRRGTCGALPGRPRRQMASRYAYHHPHPQAVPQRHSNVSPRGWPDGRFGHHSPPSPPPQRNPHINSVRATVPYVPSVQPSMVVLTTADPPISKLEPQYPPPLPPKHHRRRKQVCIPPFAFLFHRVAWVTKPHPSPPHRPPRWSLPTTTLCSAETDPNSPRCPCHPPCPPMLSKDDTPEPAVS